MNIFTLTLNPAFDIHAQADGFALHRESVASVTSRDAGGKGVNISRALDMFGVPNRAMVLLGKENGAEFAATLDGYGLSHTDFVTEGRIRENITVHVAGEPETRLSFRGFSAGDTVLDVLEAALLPQIEPGDAVTFTGSVPCGISHARVLTFLSRLKMRGAQLVIDSKSITREDLVSLRPALIKPNEEEVAAYIAHPVSCLADAVPGARALADAGIANVMVSLGGGGALLVASGHTFLASPPKITPLSTVGAGDSAIAGFLYAASRDESAADCLRHAVAFGTAACLTEGTNPPRIEDVARLLPDIEVKEI